MARFSKPNCVGVMPKPLRIGGRSLMSYGVLIAFPLREQGVLLAEQDTWQLLAPYLPQIVCLDDGAPKIRGEWMLAGSTYAPESPLNTWPAEVRIGDACKGLRVYGPRRWEQGNLTEAEPAASVGMSWASTWGGPSVPENTVGCGVRTESGDVVVPSIELPAYPWKNPDDEGRPVCTLPLDAMRPQRRALAGTYGADYLERFFPGMPADFDWRYFNLAPQDQQIEGFWRGDEPYLLRHWHPQIPCIEGQLPRVRAALHVARKGAALERVDTPLTTVWMFPEVLVGVMVFHGWLTSSTLDGSEFDRVIVGVEKLGTPMLPLTQYEDLWTARTERTVHAVARALDDSLLIPPGFVTRFTKLEEAIARYRPNPGLTNMGERLAKQWEAAAASVRDLGGVNEQIKQIFPDIPDKFMGGVVKDTALAEELSQNFLKFAQVCRGSSALDHRKPMHEQLEDIERNLAGNAEMHKLTHEMQESIKERVLANLERNKSELINRLGSEGSECHAEPLRQIDETIASAKTLTSFSEDLMPDAKELKQAAAALDPQVLRDGMKALEQQVQNMTADGVGPLSRESAEKQLAKLRGMLEARGDEHADGAQRMAEEARAYAAMASNMPAVPPPPKDGDWVAYVKSFATDLPPPEFKPLDEADLSDPEAACGPGMRMDRRTLGQKRFRGLDLQGAEFDEVIFICCDFSGCNLARSVWRKCSFIGCDFRGAVFEDASIDDLSIQWSCLDGLQAARSSWLSVRQMYGSFCGANFEGGTWKHCVMMRVDWSDSCWVRSQVGHFITMESEFGRADFSEFQAEQSMWSLCKMTDSVWERCKLRRVNLYGSTLPRRWAQASLIHVCLRGSELKDGDWRGATLEGVDFSEAVLVGTDFSGVLAKGLYLISADLRDSDFSDVKVENGMFIGSDIRGCRFAGAGLGQCWFGLSRQDDKTDFAGADVLSCNFHPKREESVQ
jgi:uncharacterized protein YjbI with pentapeptide repeats